MGNRVVFKFGSERDLVSALEAISPDKLLDEFAIFCAEYHEEDQDYFFEATELLMTDNLRFQKPQCERERMIFDFLFGVVLCRGEQFGMKPGFGRWSEAGTINVSNYHAAHEIVNRLFPKELSVSWSYLLEGRAFWPRQRGVSIRKERYHLRRLLERTRD